MARQLFDLSEAPDRALNYHLDCLCKAIAEPPDDEKVGGGGIWEPHPSPFLRSLVEAFSSVGTAASAAMSAEAKAWLSGKPPGKGLHPVHSAPTGGFPGGGGGLPPPQPPGPSAAPPSWPLALQPLAWTPEVVEAVRAYLIGKDFAAWALEDWLLWADYIVHAHMPPGFAAQQGEWLAARAGLMAKVEEVAPEASLEQIDNVLAAMPNSVAAARAQFPEALSRAHLAAMEWGRIHAAENVRSVTEQLRGAIRSAVLQHVGQAFVATEALTEPPGAGLQTKLFDLFAEFNRDWRRIAVTEAGEIKNQGYIAAQAPGSFVKRVERYRGACVFCRNLDGRVFKVVEPDDPDKDGTKEIWAGKTNVGRSASPSKRVDGELVPRLPSELWWAAAGVQHPHCRGVWVAVKPPLPSSTPKQWKEWLSTLGMPTGGAA